MILFHISAGWTARLRGFRVLAKLPGQTELTPFPFTPGYTVTFGWRRGHGPWEEAPGEVVPDPDQEANKGVFDYIPNDEQDFQPADDLPEQKFYVRAVVTDEDGRDVTAPSGAAAVIVVHRK